VPNRRWSGSSDRPSPGKSGVSEQPSRLGELKAGWTVSVETRHEGNKEVAQVVRVVQEK
jgi:hypothetical protein